MDRVRNARITSVGTCVPETVMKSAEFEKFLDTSEDWIVARTGIRERHIMAKDIENPATMLGTKAARVALERAGRSPLEIDAVICATFTPDSFFPSTACRIQTALGCKNAFAFDVSAACAGFVYALTLANSLVVSGQCDRVLIVGSEIISKSLDWTDRTTCILFGDGAGAVVVEASDIPDGGIINAYLHSDGTYSDILELPAWGEKRTMRMKGNEVFKHAVRMMSEVSQKVIRDAGVSLDEVNLFVPHQANIRIIGAVAQQLGMPMDRVACNVERFGNTSSASIPLALDEVWSQGRINPGTRVLFTALGGGLTVGSVLVRF